MGEIVRVNGLCKRFELPEIGKEVVALDNVSFEIGKGEVLGVIGKSGAGKTTLLRMLRGYEKFDAGVIEMDGVKLMPDSPYSEFRELQKKTAFHLQRSVALWNQSVLNNIILRLRAVQTGFEEIPQIEDEYEELKEEALEILDLVGVRDQQLRGEVGEQRPAGGGVRPRELEQQGDGDLEPIQRILLRRRRRPDLVGRPAQRILEQC